MRGANDGFRFLLEMAVLISLGYWGYRAVDGWVRWVVMLGVPIAVAAIWATWVAAKSSSALDDPWRLLLELAIFGAGAAALAWAGRTTLAAALAVLAVAHLTLTFVLDQRDVSANARPSERVLVASTNGGKGS